jgi:hypothetical protein
MMEINDAFKQEQFAQRQAARRAASQAANFGTTKSTKVKGKPSYAKGMFRLWQLASLPDLGLANGDVVSLAVKAYQEQRQGLQAQLCLMLIESADGTWTPGDFGLHDDKRTFARHGRGELVRCSELEASSERESGEFLLKMEGLKIDALFKDDKQSASTFRNVVGVLVEFANLLLCPPIPARISS